MKIAVVYSLPTKRAQESQFAQTDEDTVDSATEVMMALKEKGADVVPVAIGEDDIREISHLRADCIFNLIDWTGLDLPLSDRAFSMIEHFGIPTTGATRENFMMTSDKVLMKKALDAAQLATARWQVFTTGAESVRADFSYPVILKLAWEHCSIGLSHDSVVDKARDIPDKVTTRIRMFRQPVLAEEFISGREFQVTILETEQGVDVLPPAEIVFTGTSHKTLLTYESRWEEMHEDYKSSKVILGEIPPELLHEIEKVARETFQALHFRDYARLDIRVCDRHVYILEANSNPGLSDSDEYGMTVSYKARGWTFTDFIWKIVESAMRRSTPSP